MRSYSFFAILVLCVALLLVDLLAFYWLQSIIHPIHSGLLKKGIDIAFWFFTIGLISSILILKLRLESISARRRQVLVSSLYGLTVSSFIPKLIFVIIVSILYFTNYVFSERASALLILIVGLGAGFFPFFVILYAIFRSLYRFKVHHIKLHFPNLPAAFSGLRIVHLSDTHLGSFNARYHIFDRAVNMINHLHPDLILFTGDLVNNFSWELEGWESTFQQLNARLGKFAVLGNHDYGDYSQWENPADKEANFTAIKDFHHRVGFRLLLNEAVVVEQNREQMALLGVENWGRPPFKQYGDLQASLQQASSIPFKILLSHDPTHWPEEVTHQTNIALTLSGHTHGMQASINLKNKSWSPIQYKYRHWAGLYEEGGQYLYVNRGLGWMGFPGRLGTRPEITLIELHATN